MYGGFTLILLILFSIIVYYAFILPRKDKLLFALYEDRDNLALYAMNTPGKQDEEEYQYLINMINIEIYYMRGNFSFSDFFSNTVKRTVENEKEIEKIIAAINKDEYMKMIYEHSFGVFGEYFSKKFKIFSIIVLMPLTFILSAIIKFLEMFVQDDSKKVYFGNAFVKTSSIPKTYEQYMKVNKAI